MQRFELVAVLDHLSDRVTERQCVSLSIEGLGVDGLVDASISSGGRPGAKDRYAAVPIGRNGLTTALALNTQSSFSPTGAT